MDTKKKLSWEDNAFKVSTLFVLLFVTAGLFIYGFSGYISKNQAEVGTQRLKDTVRQQAKYVDELIRRDIKYMESIANILEAEDLDSDYVTVQLKKLSAKGVFNDLSIVHLDDKYYTHSNSLDTINKSGYFGQVQSGKHYITDVHINEEGEQCLDIVIPVMKNGEVVAGLRGSMYTQNIGGIIEGDFFDGAGYFYIVDSKGNILYVTESEHALYDGRTYFESIKDYNYDEAYAADKTIEDISVGREGVSSYSYNGKERYACYSPIGINDWSIVIAVPKRHIDSNAELISEKAALLVLRIIGILGLAFLLIVYNLRRSHKVVSKAKEELELIAASIPGGIVIAKNDADFTPQYISKGFYELVGYERDEYTKGVKDGSIPTEHPQEHETNRMLIKEQLTNNREFSVDVRMYNKYSGYIWVHCSGRICKMTDGTELLYIVLVNITENIDLMKRLTKEQEFNNLISNLSDDGFFDCDLLNNTIRYSRNFADRFGISETMDNYPQSLLEAGVVAKDSVHIYETRFANADAGVVDEEVQLYLPSGEIVWYLFRYSVIRDEKGQVVRAVGKMTDITKQKVKISELADKAQRDQLTGIYNKATTEQLIRETLAGRNECSHFALMIVDVDNFKNINDTCGHLYGDIFLSNLAGKLKSMFRPEDIIGRIGGDEFFVFVKDVYDPLSLQERAIEICRAFQQTHVEHGASCNISVSIGIAFAPEHGVDFDTLYKNADLALYATKAAGKNNYTIYHDGLA